MNSRISQIVGTVLQSDLAMKLVQNEALMKALLKAFSVSVEARTLVETQLKTLLANLDLAQADEVESLRREVEALRRALEETRSRAETAVAQAEAAVAAQAKASKPKPKAKRRPKAKAKSKSEA